MKQIMILLIAVFFFTACEEQKNTEETAKKIVVVMQPQDTIVVESDVPILTISESKKKLIDSFRPPLRDIAYYMILNEDDITTDYYCFKCGEYEFWTANDYWSFKLYKPFKLNLTDSEKQYFWKLYITYKETKRLFKYENQIQIVLQKQ